LLRLVAPMLFLAEVLALGALRAPQWAFLVAFFSAFALLFAGKQISRSARRRAGTTPTLPLKRLLREGGLAIVAVIPIIVILIVATSR
ncbi:MAG: hypothetical protein ACRDJM_07355, partial [Actinomycetota bacterium]